MYYICYTILRIHFIYLTWYELISWKDFLKLKLELLFDKSNNRPDPIKKFFILIFDA